MEEFPLIFAGTFKGDMLLPWRVKFQRVSKTNPTPLAAPRSLDGWDGLLTSMILRLQRLGTPHDTPLKIFHMLGAPKMEVWFRWFSFANGVFLGSRLIFRGVFPWKS